ALRLEEVDARLERLERLLLQRLLSRELVLALGGVEKTLAPRVHEVVEVAPRLDHDLLRHALAAGDLEVESLRLVESFLALRGLRVQLRDARTVAPEVAAESLGRRQLAGRQPRAGDRRIDHLLGRADLAAILERPGELDLEVRRPELVRGELLEVEAGRDL